MILYELGIFLIIEEKIQELRRNVVTGSLMMSIEKRLVHNVLINLSMYLKYLAMNKTIISISLILAILFFLPQTMQAQRFKAGVVAGLNASQIDGDRLLGFHKIGIHTGLKVYTILSERWEVGLSFLYTQQGTAAAKTDVLGSRYDKIKLNFVEVPLMIHFNEWKFKLGTGISYSNLINYTVIDVLGQDISELENYNSNIFSFIVGVSLKTNDHLWLNLRWSKSINNIFDNSDRGQFRSRVIGLRAIYIL